MIHTEWHFFADYEKEERWLNEMSARGLQLQSFFLCRYTFRQDATPSHYYLQLLDNVSTAPASQAYLSFLQENGVELVCTWHRWMYLRSAVDAAPLFTNHSSRVQHERNVMLLLLPPFLLNLFNMLNIGRMAFVAPHSDIWSLTIISFVIILAVELLVAGAIIRAWRRWQYHRKQSEVEE